MSTTPETSVQIEVTVQDYFFGEEDAANNPGEFDINRSSESTRRLDVQWRDATPPIAIATWQEWFQIWLNHLKPELATHNQYELSLRLTNDAEIQTLNAQYRQIEQPTDVLAFAALETDYPELDEWETAPLYLGDIVISVETAQQQAIAQQHSLNQELAWLAAHGLLHLLGWDHPDDDSLALMLHQQAVLLQTVGLISE